MMYFGSQRAMGDYIDGLTNDIAETIVNMKTVEEVKINLPELEDLFYELMQVKELYEDKDICRGWTKEYKDEIITKECEQCLDYLLDNQVE